MSRSLRAQWWNTVALAGGGLLLTLAFLVLGQIILALIVISGFASLTYAAAPRRRARPVRHWEAQDSLVRDGRIIVYWRPGCFFCTRLRLRLGPLARQATWVDIWADPEAAAFVRDVNGGAETVPTVILPDGEACTNPDPALVRAHLLAIAEAA